MGDTAVTSPDSQSLVRGVAPLRRDQLHAVRSMWPQLLALIVLPVAALQPSVLGHGIVGRTSSVRQGPVVAMAGFGAKKVVKKPVKPKYNGKET
eukprot:5815923-Prymnesium_polylepis.1